MEFAFLSEELDDKISKFIIYSFMLWRYKKNEGHLHFVL